MNTLIRPLVAPIAAVASWLVVTSALAAPIPGLFNTGVLGNGSLAAVGSTDLHYTLVTSADPAFPGPDAIVADISANGYWLANSASSQWIAPAVNQGYPTGAASHPGGTYIYRLTFDLTGFNPATASVSGSWAADNQGTDIRINGTSTGNTVGSYNPLASFTIASGFVAGLNTLDFVINQIPSGGSNPTGVRVENLAGTATPVPAPAAGWLLGSGLLGALGWKRRQSMTA